MKMVSRIWLKLKFLRWALYWSIDMTSNIVCNWLPIWKCSSVLPFMHSLLNAISHLDQYYRMATYLEIREKSGKTIFDEKLMKLFCKYFENVDIAHFHILSKITVIKVIVCYTNCYTNWRKHSVSHGNVWEKPWKMKTLT